VVLALHGARTDGLVMAHVTHLDEIADRSGFIVVYPVAEEGHWTDPDPRARNSSLGRGPRILFWPINPGNDDASREVGGEPINDIPYFDAVLDKIESDYSVDPARIYATGFTDGGFMAFRLGCQLADRIAAVATVAATLPEELAQTCSDWAWRSVALLMINGTSDPIVPYNGRPGFQVRFPLLSVKETVKVWSKMDGCSEKPKRTTLPSREPDWSPTQVESYTDCKEGGDVILYSVAKGGNTWPGGDSAMPDRRAGPTSNAFDASQEIWTFLSSHALPPQPR